jgi:hypothetical protein
MPRVERRAGAPRRESDPATSPDRSVPRLPPERAFVVQLEIQRPADRRTLRGRVEHLSTGEARRFASAAELVAFLNRFRGGEE